VLRKIVSATILLPLVVIIVAFAVTNRQPLTISFDPFSQTEPAFAVTLPVFVVLFAALIVGVMIGGFTAWVRQGRWRRAARRLDADIRAVREELHALRRHHAQPPPPAVDPPAAIPPPAA